MTAATKLTVGFDRVAVGSGPKKLAASSHGPAVQPFLKWTGGKKWLTPLAPALLSDDFKGRYFEPFLGGGSMFFATGVRNAKLADANKELIDTYLAVRDEVDDVISELSSYPHDLEFFLEIRGRRPRSSIKIAARMIYLNKTAFNGMYRVNRRGEFNVPFGKYVNPTICAEDRLRAASEALAGIEILQGDFAKVVGTARRGDIVYLDPPYVTGHTNNGFLKYNRSLFQWHDQERLANCASALNKRGVKVVVSNANFPDVVNLYRGFRYYAVSRKSLIGGSGSDRGTVQEALLTNFDLLDAEAEVIGG